MNEALNDRAVNDINVVADAEISVAVPEGVKVTIASGVTLTAQGDLSGVTFSDGAKLVVPEGQTATVGGKEYASGSYEAQKGRHAFEAGDKAGGKSLPSPPPLQRPTPKQAFVHNGPAAACRNTRRAKR